MSSFLLNLAITSLVSISVTCLTLYYLIPYLTRKAFLDIPNSRSSHVKVTPRGGGLAVVAGILTGSCVAFFLGLTIPHFTFYIGLVLMAITSFLDDKKSLPVYVRLSAHIIAMGLVIGYTGGLKFLPFASPLNFELGYFGYVVSAVWIISVINFFNFLDGIDGFAGSQAMVAGVSICTVFWKDASSVVGIIIALSALGFLFFNWHPAKVFMGDVGSVSLGFAFATLPFYSTSLKIEEGVFSIAIFLWFFLADGAFTLIRRILNKEKIWEAHRSHLYQRLNKFGWPHDKIVIMVIFLSVILSSVQIYCVKQGIAINWYTPGLGIFLFIFYVLFVFKVETKKK